MTTDNTKFYGIGKGSAQVIDNSGLQNQFAQMLQKQQQQRQLEIKQLTDQQAQLKPDGLRNDADRKDFFNGVNDWRTKAIAATQERDPYKKSLLKSQADQAYMQAQSLVDQSKKAAQTENGFSTQLLNPTVRDRYAPEVVNNFLKNKQLGVNDPNFVKDPNTWEQVADHEKSLQGLDKIADSRLKQTQFGTPVLSRRNMGGGRMATFITNSRTADPTTLATDIGTHYDVDQNLRKTFQDIYPQIYSDQTLSPAQQKQAAIGQYLKDRGPVSEYHAPVEKVDPQPDRFYEHYNYELKHPKAGASAANQPTPSQILLTDMQQGKPGTGEKLMSLAPKSNNYDKGGSGKLHPTVGLDKNTGEHLFYFPAQKDAKIKMANDALKASAKADGDEVDKTKLKNEDKFPETTYRLNPNSPTYIADAAQMMKDQNMNLTQLNQIEGLKSGHGQIPQAQVNGQPKVNNQQSHGKTTSMDKINSLVGKKGYEGYTAKELADYYKGLGYTIK